MMRRLYFACTLLLFTCVNSFSQELDVNCPQTLRLARATYEQGRLHEIEKQLIGCLETGFSKEQKQLKVEGYKILCLSYIYLEEPDKADAAMLNLKRTDPYFEPNPQVDPAEFVALYNTFRKNPIYRIGVKLGGNFSRPNVTENISAVKLESGSGYKPLFGLQLGAAADFPLFNKFTLHGELLFKQHRFQIDEKVNRGIDVDTGNPLTNEFTGIELQSWLGLPISLEFAYLSPKSNLSPKSKFHEKYHPYVSLGFEVDYLLGAKITGERVREGESSITESTIEVKREKINMSVMASTGIKIKIASGLFVADVRYLYGITEVSKSKNAYDNQKLLWDYGYADPAFKMGSFAVNVSYVQDIFKPKKLRKK